MKFEEGRSVQSLRIFKSEEMNFQLMRAMAYANEKGAEIGECLAAASRIKDGDPSTWVDAFTQIGTNVEALAQASLKNKELVSAREALLRATNYFRAAEYFASPKDKRFHDTWRRDQKAFETACTLMECRTNRILIPFEGKAMPGYLLSPNDGKERHPTLMIHGGADSTGEELYFLIGAAALRRGYNAFIFEGPGHRGAVHLYPKLVERPDFEVPTRVAVDFLIERGEVDPSRMALIGFSAGGYRCARAVTSEKRIKAAILTTPIRNVYRVTDAVLGGVLSKTDLAMIDPLATKMAETDPMLRVSLDYWMWTHGTSKYPELIENLKAYTIEGLEHNIDCAVLALIGEGEGREMMKQTQEFCDNIASKQKKLRVFTVQEGAEAHCQLDNLSLMHQVVFNWLDQVL